MKGKSMSAENPMGIRRPGRLPRHWKDHNPTFEEAAKVHFGIDVEPRLDEMNRLRYHAKHLKTDSPQRQEEMNHAALIEGEISTLRDRVNHFLTGYRPQFCDRTGFYAAKEDS